MIVSMFPAKMRPGWVDIYYEINVWMGHGKRNSLVPPFYKRLKALSDHKRLNVQALFKLNQQINFKGNEFIRNARCKSIQNMSEDTFEENQYLQGKGRFDLIPKNIQVKSTLSTRYEGGSGTSGGTLLGAAESFRGSWVWPDLWWVMTKSLNRDPAWLHLSWGTKECLSGCDEWMWVWMDLSWVWPARKQGGCAWIVMHGGVWLKELYDW